jgi:uncharacterized delta-60 repeat protein
MILHSQTANWVYPYDGPGNGYDAAFPIVYGLDGYIYAAGSSTGDGASVNFTVISFTTSGDTNWVHRYPGPGSGSGTGRAITYGSDGNIYAAGRIMGDGTGWDFTVISLAASGDTNWTCIYNGPGNNNDDARSIVYGSDSNVYAAGMTRGSGTLEDFTIISLSTTGDTNWTYRYNGPGNSYDQAYSIVYGSDNNIYGAGYTTGTTRDFIVISLTASGDTNWVYTYDGPGSGSDEAFSIVYGSDGNIYAAGYSTGSGTSADFTVISLTTTGDTNWVYRYDGPGSATDCAYSIIYGTDGSIYASGMRKPTPEPPVLDYDFTVISLTTSGDTNWVYGYNGPGDGWDRSRSIAYGPDGNIYAAGQSVGSGTLEDFTVISLGNSGNTNWIYRYNGSGYDDDQANSIVYGLDGNIYAAGVTYGSSTSEDFTVISLGTTGVEEIQHEKTVPEILSAPTLFKDKIYLKINEHCSSPLRICLYNVLGNCVYEKYYSYSSTLIFQGDVIEKLGEGIYFLSVFTDTGSLGKIKLIKL